MRGGQGGGWGNVGGTLKEEEGTIPIIVYWLSVGYCVAVNLEEVNYW